ncbi:DUF3137 domain-containing protein [Alkaliphilus serpentinus]|uniref:DUF3137 domain-containing protein n=1 Tax=Alkaliphilus serpentinus TaxID=1482731 RepID=A0A833HLN0_9FIRM|nr:DUF3137 domain-containing protein [Alkaliphilus serpentinus]KAB3526332.1 DUF3137 domain-containing protein [Alkaliphilus serpentinus]
MGLFGPSKNDVWKQFADEIGGEFLEGSIFKPSMVQVAFRGWNITLDTYTVSHGKSSTTYTRIRAPFVSTQGFHFKIYKKGLFSDLGKMLGMQDIITGNEDFDENYIIKGNNEELVKGLFSSVEIRTLIEEQPKMTLEIKDSEGFFKKTPEGVDLLHFQEVGVIKDIERLKRLFMMFSIVISELVDIGAATYEDPKVDYLS